MPLCLLTPASQHSSLNGRCPPSDLWLFDLWLGHSESGGHIIPIHPLFEVQLVFFLTFWEVLWPFFLKFFFFFKLFEAICVRRTNTHICAVLRCVFAKSSMLPKLSGSGTCPVCSFARWRVTHPHPDHRGLSVPGPRVPPARVLHPRDFPPPPLPSCVWPVSFVTAVSSQGGWDRGLNVHLSLKVADESQEKEMFPLVLLIYLGKLVSRCCRLGEITDPYWTSESIFSSVK